MGSCGFVFCIACAIIFLFRINSSVLTYVLVVFLPCEQEDDFYNLLTYDQQWCKFISAKCRLGDLFYKVCLYMLAC